MAEYTPGPWEVQRYELHSQARPSEIIPVFSVRARNTEPNEFYSGEYFSIAGDLDSEADARLIAAAPALLDVAERLAHLVARLRLRSPATDTERRVWAELREAARAAIESARKG